MRRMILAGAAAATLTGGCATGPLLDNPTVVRPDRNAEVGNPVLLAPDQPGSDAYAAVFTHVYSVLAQDFEIDASATSRYSGRIRTLPKLAPGLEQLWKRGSPDAYERLLATLQTYRFRAEALIEPAERGGYLVHLTVWKELEDLPRPTQATAGAAAFRSDNTVERQFEVVDANVLTTTWIPKGREPILEQALLRRIQKCP